MTVKEREKIKNNIILFICILLLLFFIFYIIKNSKQNKKIEKIDKDRFINVEVIATQEQMEYLKNNTLEEPYIKVDVIIDGTRINNCGLRTKGSYAYEDLKKTNNETRYGYRLELDYYIKGQNYAGINKFLLNTGLYDRTCIKEMLLYDIYEKGNVKTVNRCLCDLTIAGKDEGVYTLVEEPNEYYVSRYFGNTDVTIYKPKVLNQNKNRTALEMSKIYDGRILYGTFDNSRANILEDIFKHISEDENIDEYVNISEMLNYLTVCFFIDNCDSYIASTSKNYYICQQGQKIFLLPYDLNFYFSTVHSLDYDIFFIKKYKNIEKKPIIYKILNKEEHFEEYKQRMQALINSIEEDDYIYKRIDTYQRLIDNSIRDNRNNLVTYDEFNEAIDCFKKVIQFRIEYVQSRLDGRDDFDNTTIDSSTLRIINSVNN